MFVKRITYSAICIALTLLLGRIKLFTMPQGGDVTAFSMLFIALIGYWFGTRTGVICGIACGLLHLVLDAYVVHPAQLVLDYPLAFGALGLSGLLRNAKYGLYLGYALSVFGRFICSFLSGVIFFGEYTPEGMNEIVYSVIYNASYMLPEMCITLLVLAVPAFKTAVNRTTI